MHGLIIEAYPRDQPYPSCLVYGDTFGGDPVHSVWAYNRESGFAVVVTVYTPEVGALVCLRCGERLYPEETVRRFEMIRNKLSLNETDGLTLVGNSYEAPGD